MLHTMAARPTPLTQSVKKKGTRQYELPVFLCVVVPLGQQLSNGERAMSAAVSQIQYYAFHL